MSDASLHPLYSHYSELPVSLRIVYTSALCILGLGYVFALVYMLHTYSGRDGNPGNLTYEDLVIAYSGSGKGSKLESALRGPMAAMLPADEASALVNWVRKGADRETFETLIRPAIEKRCLSCHDGSNPHLVNLSGYDNIQKVTEQDTGTPIFTLVRVSHIHLFGLTFVFFVVGTIFSHAYVRPIWIKYLITGLPFVGLAVDIFSWYLVKIYHPFAYVTIAAGGVMGLCFAIMWVTAMYQMWIAKVPAPILQRQPADQRVIG